MQELDDLLKEKMDYLFSQVHTTFPGVVTEYDATTRRAIIQPSLKRYTGKKEFVEFPLLIDVPVQYPGTKKFTIHFPLEKGDEVAVFFSERAIGLWKQTGMDGIEDPKPRRFSLPDAYCTPGLQPVEFIPANKEGALQVLHHTAHDGDFISSVIMDDDMVETKYKEKATVLMDEDHIRAYTEKCSFDMTRANIVATNGKDTIRAIDGDIDEISPKPIGINGGGSNLNEGSLTPYWNAEKAAFDALFQIVNNPNFLVQMTNADGMTGSLGSLIAFASGMIAFTAAQKAADDAAKASSKPIIK
jgi:hypothetical protein